MCPHQHYKLDKQYIECYQQEVSKYTPEKKSLAYLNVHQGKQRNEKKFIKFTILNMIFHINRIAFVEVK